MQKETGADLYNIGYSYYTGVNGYPYDKQEALEYFKRSAEAGCSMAMNQLGTLFRAGDTVEKDSYTARRWFERSIDADPQNPYPFYNLGGMYYHGEGNKTDIDKAYQMFCKVIELTSQNKGALYPESCNMVGTILINYAKNYSRAFSYFSEAAKYGNIKEAWHNLGWICEQGYGNIQDINTIIQYYEKAANLGSVPSMDAVGRLYLLQKNYVAGKAWIKKAATLGYGPSKKRLAALNVGQTANFISNLWKR